MVALKRLDATPQDKYAVREGQSLELLKELHILTRDGKMNQDSRRKIKQIFHLIQFIEPLLKNSSQTTNDLHIVDFGAGKSYLGFMLYDLVAKKLSQPLHISCIEIREELVTYSKDLAARIGFEHMHFYCLNSEEAQASPALPANITLVTALHACNTATDDAIAFALQRGVPQIVIAPCCQAEIANLLNARKALTRADNTFTALWKYPLHTREFGSHLTNVLRCLHLESQGYSVTVTELVGWEHSLKNELIIASKTQLSGKSQKAAEQLKSLLLEFNLESLATRFQISL